MVESLFIFNKIVCCTSAEALQEGRDHLLVAEKLEYDGGCKARRDSGEGGKAYFFFALFNHSKLLIQL